MSPGRMLRLNDCDTGESTLDVVRVPEGWSFQLQLVGETGFVSVVLDIEAVRKLQAHLLATEAAR